MEKLFYLPNLEIEDYKALYAFKFKPTHGFLVFLFRDVEPIQKNYLKEICKGLLLGLEGSFKIIFDTQHSLNLTQKSERK